MRTDIHSPANFDPAAYEYVGSFDNWPPPGSFVSPEHSHFNTAFGEVEALTWCHAEYKAARSLLQAHGVKIHFSPEAGTSQCDHCGAHIRYVTVYRHKPTGEYLAVGSVCAEERFGCDSRREYDIKKLKEHAASEKEKVKAFGKAAAFVRENCEDLEPWLLSPKAEEVHHIFADLARKVVKWGSLSAKQVAFARKLLQEYYEKQRNGGKTDKQLAYEKEKANAKDCPAGRMTLTVEVIKTEVRDTQWGTSLKMLCKHADGYRLWGSVPAALQLFTDSAGVQRGLRAGDKVQLTATLQPSGEDSKFGFYSRPYGKLLEPVTA